MSDRESGTAAPAPGGAGQPGAVPLFREAYFPTFVFYRDLPGAAGLNAQLLTAIRAQREADREGIVRSNEPRLGGWHSRNELHRHADFAFLADQIRTFAREAVESLAYDPACPIDIDNMWSIINPPGSHNRTHIHPNSLWSGVYYVQAPPKAGRISFVDPRTQHLMHAARYDPDKPRTADTWVEVYYEPTPGRMLLFPSWLYHSVETNLTEETGEAGERVIISYNLYQRRA